jgi:hypothetical protein
MMSVGEAISKIQALLGDPRGMWVKKSYVLPLLDLSYRSIYLNMKNASGKELQAVVTLPNVPAGTTSLYPYQGATLEPGADPAAANPPALLRGLFDPIEIFVKQAGQPVYQYTRIRTRDTLPHVNPDLNTTIAFGPGMYYTWMGNRLAITPVNLPLDIEVTGKFNPPPLYRDEDLMIAHEDVGTAVCFDTAAIAGVERSNPSILEGYAQRSIAIQDNIIAEIMRSNQSNPARFQKMSRDNGNGYAQWFWSV